jgi:predicted metal-dependent hydrolase
VERSEQKQGILRYGDQAIPYSVSTNSARTGQVKINVRHDGQVEVEAPEQASIEAISTAVQKRARWIVSHVASAHDRFKHVLPREYVSGEQIFYLGRRYSLKVGQGPQKNRQVKLKGALLEVSGPDLSRDAVRANIRAWYRIKARDYLRDRIRVVSRTLPWPQESPPFQLLEMQTQWGNCATTGTITLNPFLVKAPRDCIDYVITHELCHLREHNHSREFFKLLATAMPGWERMKAKLDDMAEVLLND